MDPTHTWGKGQGAWWSKGLVYEFVDLGRFLWGKNAFPQKPDGVGRRIGDWFHQCRSPTGRPQRQPPWDPKKTLK